MALQTTGSLINSAFYYIFLVPVILLSLTIHEYSHAMMADFLGDPTPRRMGRLSLNPLRHLELVGTLLLFFAGFGWAKPVIVDPANFRVPRRAMLSVALAGPFSNFLLAILGGALLKALAESLSVLALSPTSVLLLYKLCETIIIINISLALFNLLPIPPLDGSRITSYFIPNKYRLQYRQFEELAPMLLLILFAIGGLGVILSPAINSSFNALNELFGNPVREIGTYLMSFKAGDM
ncbi:MAG: site-2 protease family protein [Candidatus Riflebacteria bacterium]|nr:site-2 protease family protein [Candidatus Riflebacteria bacterium]